MSSSEVKICTCSNCGEPLWPQTVFCPRCGQKTYQGPPSFGGLFSEFIETVFSLDNRLFRTLKTLAIPGRLTSYFLSGRQKPYFHPLRLFFVSGVLMVAAFSFYTTSSIGDALDASVEERRAIAYENLHAENLRTAIDSIRQNYPGPDVAAATDSLLNRLRSIATDKSFIGYMNYEGGFTFTPTELDFSHTDYMLLTPEEIVQKYEIKGLINQYQVKQIVRLTRLGLPGVTALMGQIIWGLVMLVPMTALMLKLIYIRRKRKYVEHFIFTLHVHAFLFLAMFLAALELLLAGTTWLLILGLVGSLIYFLLSLKSVYGQGWDKTLVKGSLLGLGYLFLLPVAISIAAIVAVLAF